MARTSLPHDLDQRIQVVWQQLGHLMDWCESSAAWTQLFCAEDRPFRETFCWESVASMICAYLVDQPAASPEDALTDCLIATECPLTSDDGEALTEFHRMWQEILIDSQEDIEALMQRDLELSTAGRDSRNGGRFVCCRPPGVATSVGGWPESLRGSESHVMRNRRSKTNA